MPHGVAMYHDDPLRWVDAKCLGMEKPLFGAAFFMPVVVMRCLMLRRGYGDDGGGYA